VKQPDERILGQKLRAEVEADAKSLSARLFPSRPPGMEKLTYAEYVEYVREKWAYVSFREQLLRRISPKAFLALARDVLGISVAESQEPAEDERLPEFDRGAVAPLEVPDGIHGE
jgi:hypothetical protein